MCCNEKSAAFEEATNPDDETDFFTLLFLALVVLFLAFGFLLFPDVKGVFCKRSRFLRAI